MSLRDRVATGLLVVGVCAVVAAAWGLGGPWWALGVAGGLVALVGFLLGYDTGPGSAAPTLTPPPEAFDVAPGVGEQPPGMPDRAGWR